MITIKYQSKDPSQGWLAQDVRFVPNQRLKFYLKPLRLLGLSLRCDVVYERTREKVRLNIAPPDGSSIILQPVGKMSA